MNDQLFDRQLVAQLFDNIVANVADPEVRHTAIKMRAFFLQLLDTTQLVADTLDIHSVRAELLEERGWA